MKINSFAVIQRAVFEGVAMGFKYINEHQSELNTTEKLISAVAAHVMNEINTVIIFDENYYQDMELNPAIQDEADAQEENKNA